jgi:hypothetical protein
MDTESIAEYLENQFRQILDLAEVSRDSNFFVIGGDSLSALMLAEAIRSDLGVVVDFETFPLWLELHALAEWLESEMHA